MVPRPSRLVSQRRPSRHRNKRIPSTCLISALHRTDTRCEAFGIFSNFDTLEVDLFNDEDFTAHIIETLREHNFSAARQALIDGWETDPVSLVTDNYLAMIETIGKGRFAQRLASRVSGVVPPDYIKGALDYVIDRV